MATEVRWRKGTTVQHASFTGAPGEITVDTDKKVTVIHDGSTVGGFPSSRETTVSGKANSGANSDITSLTGLTTALSIPQGGTGAVTAAAARTALGAAALGVNIDITSLGNGTSTVYTTAGTSTAYTITPNPAITAYTTGQSFSVNFNAAQGVAPTLQINGISIPPSLVMQQSDGTYVTAVGIPINHRSVVTLISTTQALVITMPPVSATSKQIQVIAATVASNALTLQLNPTTLDFRSSTLGSGTVNTRAVSTTITLVVPSTATLGTVSAVASRLVLIALDNSGTVELAVVNIAGGTNLDETTLISTTAISAAATSASVVYSTTARTNVTFRVVGYVESTQATAGTWATAPSTIQGFGGQALSAMSSLGYGQTWQNVTASRALSTTYYNTTGRPIFVIVGPNGNTVQTITFTVNGVTAYSMPGSASGIGMPPAVIVPPSASYSCTFSTGTLALWTELR